MPITIYKMDASPPARAVLMIAEFLKLKYETKEVNVLEGDNKKPEYVAKNPLHTIPLLEDGDFVLADSHAIITYLVSKYGADKRAELYPSDLALRATIDQRLYFEATVLFPICRATIRSILLESAAAPSEKQIEDAKDAYGVLEKYLQTTKFVARNYVTLADVSIVATISTMNELVPVGAEYEKVLSWLGKLQDEEWYQKANVLGLTQLTSYLKMSMEKNGA